MGWFDEEIRDLEKYEDKLFADSVATLNSAVTGKFQRLNTEEASERLYPVLEEILSAYRIKMVWTAKRNLEFEEQLKYLLRPYGMMWRYLDPSSEWYKEEHGPILATLQDGRPVAVLPRKGKYYYKDPDTGGRIVIGKENASAFTNVLYEIFRALPAGKLTFRDNVRFILSSVHGGRLVLVLLFTFLFVAMGSMIPRITTYLFDTEIVNENQPIVSAVFAAIVIFAVVGVRFFFGLYRDNVLHKGVTRIAKNYQAAIMMRVYSLPVSEITNYSAGDIGNHIMKIEELLYTVLSGGITFFVSALFSLIYLAQCMDYAPDMEKHCIIFIVEIFLVNLVAVFVQYKVSKEALAYKAEEDSLSLSLIHGVQKITLTGSAKRAFVRWTQAYKNSAVNKYRPPMFLRLVTPLTTAIISIGMLSFYGDSIRQTLSVSAFYGFYTTYFLMLGFITEACTQALAMASAVPIFELLKPVFQSETENAKERIVVNSLNGTLALKHVSFGYSKEGKKILDNLDFTVNKGEYVALVGKSGCGKSTTIKLLLGFENPGKGDVFYNGQPLRALDLKSVRKNIGVVLQSGTVIRGTIEDNIKLNNANLTEEEVWEAAKTAGLEEDILMLPLGLKTPLPYGGKGMSGGQIQKIMIARAVANHPGLLIFDEATSALDNVSQKHISDALDQLSCTRIVVAHRLSTIKNCDRILVLDEGKIIEEGDYDTLMQKNGFFTELVRRQQMEAYGV